MVARVDQVRTRPGGRNAEVRARVFGAVAAALERGEPELLSIESLARASGVHRATIYRRWLSSAGLVADLLAALTPIETPLPASGDLRADLVAVATRVAATVVAPMSQALWPMVVSARDGPLAHAAAAYWASLFERTAEVIRRAQRRRDADPTVDAVEAMESLLAPIYLRALVTHQSMTPADLERLVDRTLRMLKRVR